MSVPDVITARDVISTEPDADAARGRAGRWRGGREGGDGGKVDGRWRDDGGKGKQWGEEGLIVSRSTRLISRHAWGLDKSRAGVTCSLQRPCSHQSQTAFPDGAFIYCCYSMCAQRVT